MEKRFVIVSNGTWRRWIFEPSDYPRAERFAKKFDLSIEHANEVPNTSDYVVWVKKDDADYSRPIGFSQLPLNTNELFV